MRNLLGITGELRRNNQVKLLQRVALAI